MLGRVYQFITSSEILSNWSYFQFSKLPEPVWPEAFVELQCYICSVASTLASGKRPRIKVRFKPLKTPKSAELNLVKQMPHLCLSPDQAEFHLRWHSLPPLSFRQTLFLNVGAQMADSCSSRWNLKKSGLINGTSWSMLFLVKCGIWHLNECIFKFCREILLRIYSNVLCNHF